jgi:hypothetical protein
MAHKKRTVILAGLSTRFALFIPLNLRSLARPNSRRPSFSNPAIQFIGDYFLDTSTRSYESGAWTLFRQAAMYIQSTKVTELPQNRAVVEVVMADAREPQRAKEHIAFRLEIESEPNRPFLAIQRLVLQRVRDVVVKQLESMTRPAS